jgi:hypothetical protein
MSQTPELPAPTAKDAQPARLLLTELATRIATQRLHYRAGDEETAVTSLYDLFQITRELMAEHWEALAFGTAATHLLNDILRSNTARWHRWIVDKKFADERSRRQFRYELQQLQPQLAAFSQLLKFIAEQKTQQAKDAFAALAKQRPNQEADLGGKIHAGIAGEVPLKKGSVHPRIAKENFATAEDIDRAEHAAILERRNALAREDELAQKPPADPSLLEAPLRNAAGLCLSGGGIRSATFCLGIVQVLARKGLFARFDYLSTVSGGGYFGSFLTAFLGTAAQDPADAPGGIRKTIKAAFTAEGGRESAAMRHLRNNSRYLLSGGLWGHLKRTGLIISGIVTNILLMLPLPLMAVLVVWGLTNAGYWTPARIHYPSWWDGSWAFFIFAVLGIVLLVAWFALPIVRNIARGGKAGSRSVKVRIFWETACVILAVIALIAGIQVLIPGIFDALAAVRDGRLSKASSTFVRQLAQSEKLIAAIAAVAPLLFGLLAAHSKPGTRKKKWTTLLFALSGPLLALAVFLVVGNRTVGPNAIWPMKWVIYLTVALGIWGWFCVDLNEFSPHQFYRNRLCECYLAVRQRSQRGRIRNWIRRLLHGRKKDETYKTSGVGAVRQLPLSSMNATKAAPYHLINTAVNLPASLEPNLRGRDCDFFTFSRDYSGGPVCGYIKTKTVEKLDPHVDLGTAMAVSGAAASSNMGVNTMRHLRFLLTLLNIRLGYWLRNPIAGPRRWWNAPGPRYLLREMTGWMHEKTGYLNLSDGGHIENLALYEMLRRRCKFIVVIDGGQEPGMEFADFMLAQRYAEIDLGVRFDVDLADLALDAARRSRAYAVFGKVHYPKRVKVDDANPEKKDGADSEKGESGNDLGWIVYFKLARTGSEPGYVADYARLNPDFPHQTTGDQMYDEAQFEAYRRLGEVAAESLFRPEISDPYVADRPETAPVDEESPFKTLDEWFRSLANSLLPDNDEVFDRRSNGAPPAPASIP